MQENLYLEEYYGLECPICEVMRERLDKVESELGIRVVRFEVWHNKENMDRLESIVPPPKGLPFFYNRQTGGFICGDASIKELKEWALGKTNSN